MNDDDDDSDDSDDNDNDDDDDNYDHILLSTLFIALIDSWAIYRLLSSSTTLPCGQ